ncbi:MDR family MFS transporter [Anaerocolumna chitinilytica]|uniref:MFS transporter n=1 Tax=Anaerocolumna chitinilytica TaxID=1727145 RepID=A0A7I8DSK5_9FIRM|nr:MDR family MFS transporter [Anaerocolumna chitinilytica]BCK00086.1 MFS transporter [Anaerocolumna chitinilytica]
MKLRRTNLVISLMLAMFLAAVEGTIVTMAAPTITKEMHGFELISLVFSVYLLTSAISTPIYGKFADLYGRKNMLTIGILLFIIGSFLCGLSQNMLMLIIFRAIQGLGAGGIFTIPFTIIGDEFPLEERSKIQGGMSTMWGIATLIGPFLGGFLIDILSWHWLFFINIPFGLIAVLLLQGALQEHFEKKKQSIDYAGIITLTLMVLVFLSIFIFDTNITSHRTVIISALSATTLILLLLFYFVEKKAKEPIIPFYIFTRTSGLINLLSFLICGALIGINVYIPLYLQNVLGYRPTVSGLAMLPMSVSWLIISFILGKLFIRFGGKIVTVSAIAIILVGMLLLTSLGVSSPIALVLLYGFILGIGFGGATTAFTIVIQDSVEYSKRGTAVAANSLLRTLGQTIGISIFGNIFNLYVTNYFTKQGIEGVTSGNLYQVSASNNLITQEQISLSQNSSLHILFAIFLALAVFSFILSIAIPKEK